MAKQLRTVRLGEVPARAELSAEAKAARKPLPPEELFDAQNDRVHREPGRARAARTVRNKRRGSYYEQNKTMFASLTLGSWFKHKDLGLCQKVSSLRALCLENSTLVMLPQDEIVIPQQVNMSCLQELKDDFVGDLEIGTYFKFTGPDFQPSTFGVLVLGIKVDPGYHPAILLNEGHILVMRTGVRVISTNVIFTAQEVYSG